MNLKARIARPAALLTGGAALLLAAHVLASVPAVQSQANLPSVSGTTGPSNKPAATRVAQAPRTEQKPAWNELTPVQQKALLPLAASWNQLSEAHKRKWIALSQNYGAMPPGEQARLHSRMAEWAAMTPQQRTQARLNFAETQKVSTGDKKAKWEAYQALPAEEKRKLAGDAKAKPAAPATAAAVQPASQPKLAKSPKPKRDDQRAPRIAVLPNQLDHNTLLPQQGTFTDNP